jgi:hypothetical protein
MEKSGDLPKADQKSRADASAAAASAGSTTPSTDTPAPAPVAEADEAIMERLVNVLRKVGKDWDSARTPSEVEQARLQCPDALVREMKKAGLATMTRVLEKMAKTIENHHAVNADAKPKGPAPK